jgi:hypothetical protein
VLQVNVPVDKFFSVSKGTVSLPGTKAGTRRVQLEVEKWSQDRITAKMPLVSGVPDHSAVLQILNVQGLGSPGWKVPFYATRARVTLQFGENVTHIFCSKNANYGHCLEEEVLDFKAFQRVCFSGAKLRKDKTIAGSHTNCDPAVDRDEGKDQYTIELKNNWVIEQIRWGWRPSSTSEKLNLPSPEALTPKIQRCLQDGLVGPMGSEPRS